MAHQSFSEEEAPTSRESAVASFPLDHVQGCTVVVASGEIDLCTSPALRQSLAEAGRSSERIIVDLSRVTFLDSTGIGVLVNAVREQRRRGLGTLCMVGPTGSVRRVLDITQFTNLVPTYASVAEAVELA